MKKISVVVPCRNESMFIKECIEAIYHCSLPEQIQLSVFVVDGMSEDGTRDKVLQLIKIFPSLHLVDNQMQLTPFAFNIGIAQQDFDYLQIVGARHVLSPNYLSLAWSQLNADADTWCVGGKINNKFLTKTGEIISKAMATRFGMGIGNFRTLDKSGFTDTVTSPMYRADVFDKIGYFDEELTRNQDDDFNFRISNAGGKIYYCNEISLSYYVRASFSGLWRQFFQYGYWKVYVNKKHRAITTWRQMVPPIFVLYIGLMLLPITVLPEYTWLVILPLLTYVLFASVTALKVAKFNVFFIVLKSFIYLHISYGLGYLVGIIHFLLLNKKPSKKQKRMSR